MREAYTGAWMVWCDECHAYKYDGCFSCPQRCRVFPHSVLHVGKIEKSTVKRNAGEMSIPVWVEYEAKRLGTTVTQAELETLPFPRTTGSVREYLTQKAARDRTIPDSQKLVLTTRQYDWFLFHGYDMRYFVVESRDLPIVAD